MNLFLDLDGTLIDNRERYFEAYKKAAAEENLTFEKFLEIRQNFKNARSMFIDRLVYSNQSLNNFDLSWEMYIENKELLNKDSLFPGVYEWLIETSRKSNLIYCTNRRSFQDLDEQLERLNIKKFASNILLSFQKTKDEVVLKSNIPLSKMDWFIGDTAADISAGKLLGIKTCGVFSGLNSQQILEVSLPDLLLPNIIQFKF
jgi:phosphoglycolate phosphatase-like HAD superfamily hydrolase